MLGARCHLAGGQDDHQHPHGGADSDTFTFTSAGTYYFWADYPGDDNNLGATSACDSETVVVGKNQPTITTQVKNDADDTNIANGGTVAIGTVAYDTASLSGATDDVSGDVSYYVEKGDDECSVLGATSLGAKTITNTPTAVPDSDTFTFTSAGTYYFWADYPGDDNNLGATSACDSETVVVGKNQPTITTQVKNDADDTNIANGGTVAIGTVAYDTASLSGATDDVSGDVSYYVEKGDDECSVLGATSLGAKTITNTPTAVPDSDTFTFTSAGTYYFWADYPGDDNNLGATSACDSETVVVGKNQPTITTQVKNDADDTNIANGGTVAIGTVAYDTASLSGATDDVSGDVSYYVEKGDDECSVLGATSLGDKTITNTPTAVPDSDTFTFTSAGTYYFWADYPGDDNNLGATSACDSETVVVGKNQPTITTQVKNDADDTNIANGGTVAIGTVAYDTASLSGATDDVSGDVSYYVEKGDDECSVLGATSLGAKTITNTPTAVPDSDTFTFTSAGTYYFWADYPGDDNNLGATSACDSETVVVGKNQPTITTQVKNDADDTNIANGGTVAIGTVAYDTASLSGATDDVSGDVSYYVEKGDDECSVSVPPRWGPRRSPTPPRRCPTRTPSPSPRPAPTTSGPTTRVMTTTSAPRARVTPRSWSWARTSPPSPPRSRTTPTTPISPTAAPSRSARLPTTRPP